MPLPHVVCLLDRESLWTLARRSFFVEANDHVLIQCKVTINIFQPAICRFGIEQVNDRDKKCVQNGPDDIKLPANIVDADWGDKYNYVELAT